MKGDIKSMKVDEKNILGSDDKVDNLKDACSKLGPYLPSIQKAVHRRFGAEKGARIYSLTMQAFERLLPGVPYIGGDKNLNTPNLLLAAFFLALYKVLDARGYSLEDAGKIVLGSYSELVDYPQEELEKLGKSRYDQKYVDRLRELAASSQLGQYPDDWVITFIEADGGEFDYGFDILECGIQKYYRSQCAEELTTYMCLSDYIISEAFGRGLVRHETLAEGSPRCDFRYKRGRETRFPPSLEKWLPR